MALVAPIGIFFGRLANFINSELYGVATEVPWAVIFVQIDDFARHPSQLYEAFFEGIILFLILLYFRKKNYLGKPGLISSVFLIFYSIFRFIVEFFRVPDEQLGYLILNLSMGQIISLISILLGIVLFYFKNENKKSTSLPLDKFIEWALYDKDSGYYMKKNPFGKEGDFITAPNITRLFSEIISIWAITFWEGIGSPRKFNLLELGAGNGEMMKVITETLKNFPKCYNACNFMIHEKSNFLINQQKKNYTLKRYHG